MKINKKTNTIEIENFLETIRKKHVSLHKKYENLFWTSYMGDHSVDDKKNEAQAKLNNFSSDIKNLQTIEKLLLEKLNQKQKASLLHWKKYFELNQVPSSLLKLKEKITVLETKMHLKLSKRKEGYIDTKTNKFKPTSYLKMRTMMRTEDDEKLRKACFDASEKLADTNLSDYIKYVNLLNEYAKALCYEDFYAYKIFQEEGMTKKELFKIFDDIYDKTKYAFDDLKKLKTENKEILKPWNFSYFMSGNFTKEEDQYFPFDQALERWGRSFSNLGIDFAGGILQLDLLDRKGKYSNGFCHWPELVHYKDNKKIPGKSNFTCNVVYGQIGSASTGYVTLFHEGGHAAHMLNTEEEDTCLNHEYPPTSTAWAETQSMFLDTVFSSYEWKSRYAKNKDGDIYPFDLQKRKIEKLNILKPHNIHNILMVSNFEKEIYETENLTEEKVKEIATNNFKKYTGLSEDSLYLLNVPHIYSWNSTCSYHGYGLATIAVYQWREYFYKKYGHIVDNKNIGKEMKKVWSKGASKTFKEFVIEAIGENITPKYWLKIHTQSIKATLSETMKKAELISKKKQLQEIKFDAKIRMVSGKEIVATNKKSFEQMCDDYSNWLNKK